MGRYISHSKLYGVFIHLIFNFGDQNLSKFGIETNFNFVSILTQLKFF